MTSLLNSIKNLAKQTGEDAKTRFSVSPSPGDSGFTQWQNGMRAVARLPEGIPPQFRKTLWLNLAEKHLASRGVKWEQVEEFCFNEFTNPDDEELGVQIVKDVHRTGCSLFCGVSGKENQALLKRVLLAYARWNKAVGYCQGFNMLAALILQVMGKSEVDSVKVMIYLIEGVLPESYFANNLRGLSVDMAVFRDLLRLKLPTLSRHFDQLQCGDSKDAGTSYEPPLTNVFTMQWFLTLFCNCLPQETVLRVWDLIFLEGNHVLLCTALAIWSTLADRILTVESADEFYCIMGVLTREMLEFGLMDANALIKAIVSFSLPELAELREKYLYNITPWTQSVSTVAKRGLRLFYSDEDTDTEEDDEKIAIATAYGLFRSPKKKEGTSGVTSPPRSLTHPDKEKIAMDISALTKQYRKLRERQKQAHVILTAACGSQSFVGPTASPAMNHLLMGKFALVNSKGRRLGPPPGSIPPPSQPRPVQGEKPKITISGETLHWKDAVNSKKPQQKESGSDEDKSPESSRHSSRRSSSSSTSTELCDDPQRLSDSEPNSLSDSCNPAEKTEPSTPLKTLQLRASHPDDIASCKEETEETLEKYEREEINSPVELEVKTKEDTISLSITPNEDSRSITPEGEEPRRKTSFRIDPEELRQLDRKLSLKIVEIERRKSSAGIESEDLDSVLFSFDRDYIQEGKRNDRDTPSSIPDDRMCSTDDFICDFEEETIIVPDLITAHKPIRMSSLEECDETKAIELIDDDMDENDLYEGKENFKSNPESQSSDENEEESPFDTKYNFDELFNKKNIVTTEKYFNESISSPNVNSVTNYLTGGSEIDQTKLISEPNTPPAHNANITTKISGSGDSMNQLGTNTPRNPENQLTDGILLNSGLSPLGNSTEFEENNIVHNTDSIILVEASSSILTTKQEPKTSNRDQSVDNSENNILTQEKISTLADNKSKLERKLAHLLPSLSICSSFDNNLPDTAVVTSRDAEINLIREKYAKVSDETIGLSALEALEPISFPKSLTQNQSNGGIIIDLAEKNLRENTSQPDSLPNTHELSDIKSSEEISKPSETKIQEAGNKTNDENLPLAEHGTVKTKIHHINNEKESKVVKVNIEMEGNMFNFNKTEVSDPVRDNNLVTGFANEKECKERMNLPGGVLKDNKVDERVVGNFSQKEPPKVSEESESGEDSTVDVNMHEKETQKVISEVENVGEVTSTVEEFDSRGKESPVSVTSSPSSKRRGSEVALDLILKENLHILSKIQQQSRRKSEICIDSRDTCESLATTDANKTKIEAKDHIGKEISILSRDILETLGNTEENLMTDRITATDKLPEPNKVTSFINKKIVVNEEVDADISTTSSDVSNQDKSKICLSIEKSSKSATESCLYPVGVSKTHGEVKTSNNDYKSDICSLNDELWQLKKCSERINNNSASKDAQKEVLNSSEGFVNKGFIESYRYSINSPLVIKEDAMSTSQASFPSEEENSIHEKSFVSSKLSDSSKEFCFIPKLYSHKSVCHEEVISKITDDLADANEDIEKELRSLDIKPEEILGYHDLTMLSTIVSTDKLHSYKSPLSDETEFKLSSEDSSYKFTRSKHNSLDHLPETLGVRTSSQNLFKHQRAISLDTSPFSKVSNDRYLDDKRKSLARSTTLDDDNSLYMSSYKSHGRSLIEKGELDTLKTLSEETAYNDRIHCNNGNSSGISEESASDFKISNDKDLFKPYSDILSRDSKVSQMETKDSESSRYKTYSARSISPSRYRFSSASPVRKKLDTQSEPSPSLYSGINRVKSPSPTCFSSSRSLSSKEDYPQSEVVRSDYRSSKDYKKYSRTESLDLNFKSEWANTYLKKRAESVEISTYENLHEDRKTLSPTSPVKFNPFPVRSASRQPKELGVKLGLYLPPKADKSPSKRLT